MANITRETVLAALGKVEEPELHQDLVTLGMVRDLTIDGETVSFSVMLTTPACPLRGKIEKEAREAVEALGAKKVTVKLDSDVPHDGRMRGLVTTPIRNAIAVASGKGGVGKSTVAVNLAVALAQSGARVGLMDADIYGPNVPTMMGAPFMPAPRENKLIPAENYGVKIMSMGYLVKPGQPLIWRGPMLNSAIRQFLSDVEWGELDYLIIDLPPGTGDAPLSLAQSLPLTGVVIVTLPQAVSLEDASRGLEMFNQLQVPILGVVENMSYLTLPDGSKMDVFGQGGGEAMAKHYNVPFLGGIPMNPKVRIGGDNGAPILVSDPQSDSAQALKALAENVAARVSVAALRGNDAPSINII
ncbi:MAG: chromosome partitioning protein [Anaerolineae bacterium CG_4_9_14_3_um_filter_57_17]|nr:Mrp/NBP35 family ATP-binding protein [bacterium]NCT19936.1 Mrp/NBP35 family ATP-binding protein [bacterium]OIO85991.1 MAG: chromosome partitioning protein [Anaerolineae bacterium CG2_30_57_67]PJB65903.1 MAG: chromosome partitioning protein [Anaerolineae bacterium CG_4_9_14_3_um_filter_57_17]